MNENQAPPTEVTNPPKTEDLAPKTFTLVLNEDQFSALSTLLLQHLPENNQSLWYFEENGSLYEFTSDFDAALWPVYCRVEELDPEGTFVTGRWWERWCKNISHKGA